MCERRGEKRREREGGKGEHIVSLALCGELLAQIHYKAVPALSEHSLLQPGHVQDGMLTQRQPQHITRTHD